MLGNWQRRRIHSSLVSKIHQNRETLSNIELGVTEFYVYLSMTSMSQLKQLAKPSFSGFALLGWFPEQTVFT